MIIKSYKPLTSFGALSIFFMVTGLLAGFRPVLEFARYHYIYAVPSAILAAALVILSFVSLGVGLILNSVNLRLLEVEKLIRKWDVRDLQVLKEFSPVKTAKSPAETDGTAGRAPG